MEWARERGERLETLVRRIEWLNTPVELNADKPRDPVATAWSDWLGGFPWEAWGTLTFRHPDPTHAQLDRAFAGFVQWLRTAGDNEAPYFLAHEVGLGGRAHLHCLLAGLEPYVERSRAWAWWWKRYGRCEVRGYDPARGAAAYVSKYVTKVLGHYDLDLGRFARCQVRRDGPSWKRTRGRKG